MIAAINLYLCPQQKHFRFKDIQSRSSTIRGKPSRQGQVSTWERRIQDLKVIEHEHVKPTQTGKYRNMEKKRTKIIFVCHGNICRSPMAEFIFRQLVKEEGRENEFAISSAAVSYEEEGNGIYPYAADTLRKHGIPFGRHQAHRISKKEYEEADLVIVMDSSNLRLMGRISENCDKVHKLLEYADAENASNTSSNSEANEGKTSEANKGKHRLTCKVPCLSYPKIL